MTGKAWQGDRDDDNTAGTADRFLMAMIHILLSVPATAGLHYVAIRHGDALPSAQVAGSRDAEEDTHD